MSSLFYKVLEWCRWLFGVFPRSAVGSPVIYLTVHYTFMALLAILCAIFSDQIRLWVGAPARVEHLWGPIDRIWCGVMFVLMYAIIRVVLYLLQIVGIQEDSDFPDIEADWKDIVTALERERLYLDELPLFLVNGFTPQQEQSAFEAGSNIEWRVIAPPLSNKTAVVRAFAKEDAVFLCCTGIGTTNYQQGKVSDTPEPSSAGGTYKAAAGGVTGTRKAGELQAILAQAKATTGTSMAGAGSPAAANAPAASTSTPTGTLARGVGAFFGTMTPGGLKKAMETFSAVNKGNLKGYGKKRLNPLTETESVLGVRRMQFLCHLIQQARKPYCPINGMLQAIPFSWASEVDYARKLAPAIKDDLTTVHDSFQLQFPVVTVVTELDSIDGMKEFLLRAERLQPGLRLSRAGSSFAAGADIDDRHAGWIVDRGMQWFRGWVYTAFSYDIDNRDNRSLFYLLCEISQRRDALVTLLRDSLYRIVRPGPRLHGLYFAATGRAQTEQGFIRGVLDKLPESQGDVAWSPQLVRTQHRSRLVSGFLFAGAAVMAAATIWIYVQHIRQDGQA